MTSIVKLLIFRDPFIKNLRKVWDNYDQDHSGIMEKAEFIQFIKELNVSIPGLTPEDLFVKIDLDKSGKIDFQEFVKYYRELTSGKEFALIFESYSESKDFLTLKEFKRFMQEVQKARDFGMLDAVCLFNEFCEGIPKNIKQIINKKMDDKDLLSRAEEDMEANFKEIDLSLLKMKKSDFKVFLNDKRYNSICNLNMLHDEQNGDYPVTKYFMYSSHNTYLTKDQIFGKSSADMYSFAVLDNCRLVELDCWDGKNNEPIITHGHTFTSEILFKDVLLALKKNSFEHSDYPVTLSIEMHCKAPQQIIMANYFHSILKDIFVVDENNPPHEYPTLNQLKKTFIIKASRPKIIRKDQIVEGEEIIEGDEDSDKDEPLNKTNDNIDNIPEDVKVEPGIPHSKTEMIVPINKTNSALEATLTPPRSPRRDSKNASPKLINRNFKARNSATKTPTVDETKPEEKQEVKQEVKPDIPKPTKQESKQIIVKQEPNQEGKKKDKKKDEVSEMHNCAGLVSRKFHIDELKEMKYQPWDCVSVTEDSIAKWGKNIEKRKQVISYTRNSFMKVYPRGTRFDSSNCDPTKSWLCGAQISALNLQSTEDDFVLLNKLFFKINKASGFILKPEFLRNEKAEVRSYKYPCMNLLIKLISGIMLQNILKKDGIVEAVQEIAVSFKVIGSYEDDENNKPFSSDYINQNFINPIFNDTIVNFKIYEPDLSFLVIKIFSGKEIYARSVIPLMIIEEGIKLVSLYDSECKEIENSMLVLKVTKTSLTTKLD